MKYNEEIERLQIELLKLQTHVKNIGLRIALIFEGRDAAGKGGTLKRITEHLNPRGARVVALEKPSDREKTQWYFQRYVAHLPAAGEIVLFDRSWYNRAMVEPVMGYCTDEQHKRFLKYAPEFEKLLVKSGIQLFKFYFSVSKKEQENRFKSRETDPLKQYKLSPADKQAQEYGINILYVNLKCLILQIVLLRHGLLFVQMIRRKLELIVLKTFCQMLIMKEKLLKSISNLILKSLFLGLMK